MKHDPIYYLSPAQAVQYLWRVMNITYSTKYFAKLRTEGGGPIFIKHGNRVYYQPHKLEEWVSARSEHRSSTSVAVTPRPFPTSRSVATLEDLRREELDGDADIFEALKTIEPEEPEEV